MQAAMRRSRHMQTDGHLMELEAPRHGHGHGHHSHFRDPPYPPPHGHHGHHHGHHEPHHPRFVLSLVSGGDERVTDPSEIAFPVSQLGFGERSVLQGLTVLRNLCTSPGNMDVIVRAGALDKVTALLTGPNARLYCPAAKLVRALFGSPEAARAARRPLLDALLALFAETERLEVSERIGTALAHGTAGARAAALRAARLLIGQSPGLLGAFVEEGLVAGVLRGAASGDEEILHEAALAADALARAAEGRPTARTAPDPSFASAAEAAEAARRLAESPAVVQALAASERAAAGVAALLAEAGPASPLASPLARSLSCSCSSGPSSAASSGAPSPCPAPARPREESPAPSCPLPASPAATAAAAAAGLCVVVESLSPGACRRPSVDGEEAGPSPKRPRPALAS
eukprot:tig00001067_g6786.t1